MVGIERDLKTLGPHELYCAEFEAGLFAKEVLGKPLSREPGRILEQIRGDRMVISRYLQLRRARQDFERRLG